MRWIGCWLLAGCPAQPVEETAATGDSAPPTPPTDTEPGPLSPFLDASGTVDGRSVTFSCREADAPASITSTLEPVGQGRLHLTGTCAGADGGTPDAITLSVVAEGPVQGTTCLPGTFSVAATDGAGVYDCGVDGASAFSLVVQEWFIEGSGTVYWGGTFSVTGQGGVSVDLTGTFRFRTSL